MLSLIYSASISENKLDLERICDIMIKILDKKEIRPILISCLAPFKPISFDICGTAVNVSIKHNAAFEDVFEIECCSMKQRYSEFDDAVCAAERLFDAFVCPVLHYNTL